MKTYCLVIDDNNQRDYFEEYIHKVLLKDNIDLIPIFIDPTDRNKYMKADHSGFDKTAIEKETSSESGQKYFIKNSNTGLSRGALAGIVICCVAAVVAVSAIIAFCRKKLVIKLPVDNTSTINTIRTDNYMA